MGRTFYFGTPSFAGVKNWALYILCNCRDEGIFLLAYGFADRVLYFIYFSLQWWKPEQLLTRWLDKHCHVVQSVRTDVQEDTGGFCGTEAET